MRASCLPVGCNTLPVRTTGPSADTVMHTMRKIVREGVEREGEKMRERGGGGGGGGERKKFPPHFFQSKNLKKQHRELIPRLSTHARTHTHEKYSYCN